MTELVRVNVKFQVTIPVTVRLAARIRPGDYLEISAVPEGVLLRPAHGDGGDAALATNDS